MKIIGNKKEVEFLRGIINQLENVECFECPFEDRCNALQEEGIDLGICSNVVWNFIEVEEVNE